MKWTNGLPPVPVRDLAVHPRENDLIVATYGRSIYILDDISPLRDVSEELISKKLHLFEIQEAIQFQQGRTGSYLSPGDTAFSGENKRLGAAISYYLTPQKKEKSEEKMESQPLENRGRFA